MSMILKGFETDMEGYDVHSDVISDTINLIPGVETHRNLIENLQK